MQDREQFRQEIQCLDTVGRSRLLRVFVTESGYVVFQSPPGEVAQVAPSAIRLFQEIVSEAHIVAMRVR